MSTLSMNPLITNSFTMFLSTVFFISDDDDDDDDGIVDWHNPQW